jgi:hypothetical protein
MRRQVLDLSWIVAKGEGDFDHDAFAREHSGLMPGMPAAIRGC